jgi:hypothetical protein
LFTDEPFQAFNMVFSRKIVNLEAEFEGVG